MYFVSNFCYFVYPSSDCNRPLSHSSLYTTAWDCIKIIDLFVLDLFLLFFWGWMKEKQQFLVSECMQGGGNGTLFVLVWFAGFVMNFFMCPICFAQQALPYAFWLCLHLFVVVFIHCSIHILIAHHFLSPTDTLACGVGFLRQLPPQAAWWIVSRQQKAWNWNTKNHPIYFSLIIKDTKQSYLCIKMKCNDSDLL